MEKQFVVVFMEDGVIQSVGTNIPDIIVITAENDENADEGEEQTAQAWKGANLDIITHPSEHFPTFPDDWRPEEREKLRKVVSDAYLQE